LSLKNGRDVALELDDVAGYGFGWARTHQAAAEGASQYGGAENGYVAYTHENPPSIRRAIMRPESPTLARTDTG
jgi:hypothetical protein